MEVVLVNTRELARVPGRKKTDRVDCKWIQRLHSCGLLTGSFRPNEPVCMLRTLVRDKGKLVAEAGDWLRRMQKSLDQMNVRVHQAVSDNDGVTGLAIMRAIINGERDARKLAQLRDPRCRKSKEEIAQQLSGHWRADHLFSLQQALKMYDAIQERIAEYEQEILRKLAEMVPPDRAARGGRRCSLRFGTETGDADLPIAAVGAASRGRGSCRLRKAAPGSSHKEPDCCRQKPRFPAYAQG